MSREINEAKEVLKPIIRKWEERDKDITLLCTSIIDSSHEQIERIFDLTNDLSNFKNKKEALQRRISICFSKYLGERFDLFPKVLK